MNFVAIDFETANYAADSACAVGLVKVVDGEIVDSVAHLIRPPSSQFIFTYIHGLTWKHVSGADHFGDLWPKLAPWLEGADYLTAHNATFDRGVLGAYLARYEIVSAVPKFRCTVAMARRAWSVYPTKLPDVCRHLGIALDHHDALSDAMACAKIAIAAQRAARDETLVDSPAARLNAGGARRAPARRRP